VKKLTIIAIVTSNRKIFCIFTSSFFVFAIFVFRETRFFRNLGSFAKLRNSSLIFAKHENRFVASFAKFSRNEISSKTLNAGGDGVEVNECWRRSQKTDTCFCRQTEMQSESPACVSEGLRKRQNLYHKTGNASWQFLVSYAMQTEPTFRRTDDLCSSQICSEKSLQRDIHANGHANGHAPLVFLSRWTFL
jgi:hypothetical protein